jgi:hypothetical protein
VGPLYGKVSGMSLRPFLLVSTASSMADSYLHVVRAWWFIYAIIEHVCVVIHLSNCCSNFVGNVSQYSHTKTFWFHTRTYLISTVVTDQKNEDIHPWHKRNSNLRSQSPSGLARVLIHTAA